MQVDYILGTGLFVQVINILCDNCHFEVFFQVLDEFMPLVWLGGIQFMSKHVIEVGH